MANSKQHRYPNSFKHEVCQYYEHHTMVQTIEKYELSPHTICRWRATMGYRNKHRGYNLYTEGMQPALKKRERREWMVTKKDNAFLLDELTNLRVKLMNKDMDNLWLKEKLMGIADAIKTMEA